MSARVYGDPLVHVDMQGGERAAYRFLLAAEELAAAGDDEAAARAAAEVFRRTAQSRCVAVRPEVGRAMRGRALAAALDRRAAWAVDEAQGKEGA